MDVLNLKAQLVWYKPCTFLEKKKILNVPSLLKPKIHQKFEFELNDVTHLKTNHRDLCILNLVLEEREERSRVHLSVKYKTNSKTFNRKYYLKSDIKRKTY